MTLEATVYEHENRISELEILMKNLILQVSQLSKEMKEFKDEMKEFKDEMKDFKDEMKDFKDEMKDFKDEMKEFKDEMKDFKDEMKEFKDEMKEFKDWSRKNIEDTKKQIRDMNKQWGNLSNRLGTVVEDIIFPATRPLLKKYFNCDPEWLGMNIEKKVENIKGEFDVIALCNNKVFLIEVKATPKIEYINEFINDKVKRFRILFPEYKDKDLLLIFGSLRIKEDIVNYLTKKGIYAMAYKEWEYMDILNFEQIKKCRRV